MTYKELKEMGFHKRDVKDFPRYQIGDTVTVLDGEGALMVDNLSTRWGNRVPDSAQGKVGIITSFESRKIDTSDASQRIPVYILDICGSYVYGAWEFEESWDLNSTSFNSEFEIADESELCDIMGW